MNAAQEKAIREFHDLDGDIRQLIAWCLQDLYDGPHDEDGYPGFTKAVRMLADKLEECIGDVWIDEDGYVSHTEPAFHVFSEDDGDPDLEWPENWTLVDASVVKSILVGKELGGYL